LSAIAYGAGVWPSRAAALDVVGRRSGRLITLPVVIADFDGDRYLVSMLGERAGWVQNVRADKGRAILRHGVREAIELEEVPVSDRAPVVRRYVQVAPGGRPHISIDRDAPLQDFERVALEIPVFRIHAYRPRAATSVP
jgi:hypothetical protein